MKRIIIVGILTLIVAFAYARAPKDDSFPFWSRLFFGSRSDPNTIRFLLPNQTGFDR
jgi:hypothetical protein